MKALKKVKFQKQSLEKIKNNVKSDFIFSFNTATNVANAYGAYIARGDLAPLLSYEKDIESLEIKDLVRVAKKYFQSKSSVTAILRKD